MNPIPYFSLLLAAAIIGLVSAAPSPNKEYDYDAILSSKFMVEISTFSDSYCEEVGTKYFYRAHNEEACNSLPYRNCTVEPAFGSFKQDCPVSSVDLDLEEFVRVDVYNDEECAEFPDSITYFPKKNEGKCVTRGPNNSYFKIDGDQITIGFTNCDKYLKTFSKGECFEQVRVTY